jgi:uncharacterized membrane protein
MLPFPIIMGMYLAAAIFIMICIGTAIGALSKAQTDKKKAKEMGLVGFTFCLLGTVTLVMAKALA